jgi:hypothetical protein
MRNAEGKYIAVMDSDDISLPDRFAKQVELLENRPDIGLCGTRCCFFGTGGEYIGTMPPVDPNQIKASLLFLPTLSNTSLMMRHDLVRAENLYYDESLVSAEDYDLSFRFSHHCKITNLEDVLMRIRVHDGSLTRLIKADNDKWLSEVHRRVLSYLGVNWSDEELDLHLAVSTGSSCLSRNRAYVERIEKWLCKLKAANDEKRIYDPRVLGEVLSERWCLACLLAGEPLSWRLRRVRDSGLYMGYGHFLRYCLSHGGKRMLRILRRYVAGEYRRSG